MSQIAILQREDGVYDLGLSETDGEHLELDQSLRTAVLISILTEARADKSDLPPGWDLGGWWGESYPIEPGDRFGSRLWTIKGQKVTEETIALAAQFVRESLAWLVSDGIADDILLECTYAPPPAAGGDGRAAATGFEIAPGADGVEVLERKADRVHQRVAGRAGRIRLVRRESLAQCGVGAEIGFLKCRDLGRRRRRRRAEQILQYPLAANDGRGPVGVRGHHQYAALAEQAEARGIVERDPAEMAAVHAIDTVMPRDALGQKCVIGRHQLGNGTVLAHDVLEEILGFGQQPLAQVVVEVREAD